MKGDVLYDPKTHTTYEVTEVEYPEVENFPVIKYRKTRDEDTLSIWWHSDRKHSRVIKRGDADA